MLQITLLLLFVGTHMKELFLDFWINIKSMENLDDYLIKLL